MTDEELLKRVAEIEGWVWRVTQKDPVPVTGWRDESETQPTPNLMNPLTNDAQAMALVKKHRMAIAPLPGSDGWAADCPYREGKGDGSRTAYEEDESLNRSALLALVAAHD